MTLKRNEIFISYCHEDAGWLQELQVYLKPYFADDLISFWDDRDIESGKKWAEEIDRALGRAAAAVLLLSPDFFASDFIMRVEWPRLKDAAKKRGLIILPMAVRASAVSDTEIADYQGLMDLSTPLELIEKEQRGQKLVEIARRIRDLLRDMVRSGSGDPQTLTPLTRYTTMANVHQCVLDDDGRLWLGNGEQVKVFRPDHEAPQHRWLLRKRRWKRCLPQTWRGRMVMSDWDGALYALDNEHRDAPFHSSRPDSVPFHLLARAPDGGLFAASWNGAIERWDAGGTHRGVFASLPCLPTTLLPVEDGLAVVDQGNSIRLFDDDGRETWTWRADDRIHQVWPHRERSSPAFAAVVGRTRIARIVAGDTRAQEVVMTAPVVSASHRVGAVDDWLVIALEGGRLEWVSLSPFDVIRDNALTTQPLREIFAVPAQGPASEHVPTAVGLTHAGQLLVVQERQVRLYDEPAGVQKLLMAPSGRFLFLISEGRAERYRNPAVPPSRCTVDLTAVDGTLITGGFRKLLVKLRNTGSIPIHHLRAELHADGVIDKSRNSGTPPLPIAPGVPSELEFAVRVHVTGDAVPINLRLELTDEGGPPASVDELTINVEAR